MSFIRTSSKIEKLENKEVKEPIEQEIVFSKKETSSIVIGADFEDTISKIPKRLLPNNAVQIKLEPKQAQVVSKDGAEEPYPLWQKHLSTPGPKVVHPNHVFVKRIESDMDFKHIFAMDLPKEQTLTTDANILVKEENSLFFRLLDKVDGKSEFDFQYEPVPSSEGQISMTIDFVKFETPLSIKFGSHPEPLFFTCCLMDMEEKIQISENFHFSTEKMTKFHFVTKKREDVVLYVRITKILQGDEDTWMESYLKPEKIKDMSTFEAPNPKLTPFHQNVAYSIIPIFEKNVPESPWKMWYRSSKGNLNHNSFFTQFNSNSLKKKNFPGNLFFTIVHEESKQVPVCILDTPIAHPTNILYISPISFVYQSTLSSTKTIAIKIQIKDNDSDLMGEGIDCLQGGKEQWTSVTFHNKSPEFNDEIKIKCPILTKNHHILFTYYHVSVQKGKKETTLLGYSWMSLLEENGNICHGKYGLGLQSEKNLTSYCKKDKEKPCLQVSIHAAQTIYPIDKELALFYRETQIPTSLNPLQSHMFPLVFSLVFNKKMFKLLFAWIPYYKGDPIPESYLEILSEWTLMFAQEQMKRSSTSRNHVLYASTLFELIYSSYVLAHSKQLNEKIHVKDVAFESALEQFITCCSTEVCHLSTTALNMAKELNASLAKFCYQMFHVLDRGFVLGIASSYIEKISSKMDQYPLFQELRNSFLTFLGETPFHIQMSYPDYAKIPTVESPLMDQTGLAGMIQSWCFADFVKPDKRIRMNSISFLRSVLTKLENDVKINMGDVAMIYFPILLKWISSWNDFKELFLDLSSNGEEIQALEEWKKQKQELEPFFTCVLVILENLEKRFFKMWIQKENKIYLISLLEMLKKAVQVFEREKFNPLVAESRNLTMGKNQIEDMYKSIENRASEQLSEMKRGGARNFKSQIVSVRKEQSIAKVDHNSIGNLNTRMSCTITSILKEFVSDAKYQEMVLMCVSTMLSKGQTEKSLYSTLSFVKHVITTCTYKSDYIGFILNCMGSPFESIKNLAITLFQQVYKKFGENIIRIDTLLAISSLAPSITREELDRLTNGMKKLEQTDKTMTLFLEKTRKSLLDFERIHKEVRYEDKSDLFWEITKGYKGHFGQYATWLRNLAQFHESNGRWMESFQCLYMILYIYDVKRCPILKINNWLKNEKEMVKVDAKELDLFPHLEKIVELAVKETYYEYALEVYPLLLQTKDYSLLKKYHLEMSHLYDHLSKGKTRFLGTYYKVIHFGKDFKELNGIEFVYKFPKITRLPEAIAWFEKYYPNVVFCRDSDPLQTYKDSTDTKYILLSTIEPVFKDIIDPITDFLMESPFYKEGGKQDMENLYKKRVHIKVEHGFPYLLTRLKVIQKKEVILTPIECATELIQSIITKYVNIMAQETPNVNNLQMTMTGTLIPSVHEGLSVIVKTFFAPSYKKEHQVALKKEIMTFLDWANKALTYHKGLEEYGKLQEQFEGGYQKLSTLVKEVIKF